jgi:dTDP-4-amino-4,6-dideoxygalactose transaminase
VTAAVAQRVRFRAMAGTRTRRETLLGFQPPAIGEEEVEAVVATLRTGWIATGPRAGELEDRFADYTGAKHAVTLASGTAALHLALLAAGIGPGDEVITTPITWPATANVIVHAGARPVFVDVRETDLNIDPDAVAGALTPRTKAILPVHLAGQPAELDALLAHGVPVLEDATHAAESYYRGRKIGSIEGSLAACFSLNATKNIAAAEGGILTTDDDALAAAVRELRLMRRREGALYDIRVAGFKANLPDLLAALALVQLEKIERHAEIRRRHVEAYDAAVAELPGITPLARDERDGHAYHIYVVRIDPEVAGADRNAYREALERENIATSIHFLPLHRLTFYRELLPEQPPLPVAERAGAEVLSLPLSPAHTDADLEDAIDALRRVHAAFTGA